MAFDAFRLVPLLAGLAMLALGCVLVAMGPSRGLNRALGLLFGCRGMTLMLFQVSTADSWIRFALAVQPAFSLLAVVAAAYLLATLGRTVASPRQAAIWAVAAGVFLVALYAAVPSLFAELARGPASSGAMAAAPGWHYVSIGPLSPVAAMAWPLFGLLALRLAVLYRSEENAHQARSLLLLSGAFIVGALFDGANRASALSSLLDQGGAYDWLPWGWGILVLPVVAMVPALLAAAVIAANRGIDPRPNHSLEGVLLGLAAFATLTGFLRLALPPTSDIVSHPAMLAWLGAWRLVMPILATWALVAAARAPVPLAETSEAVPGGTS